MEGRAVGKTLSFLLDSVCSGILPNTREVLLAAALNYTLKTEYPMFSNKALKSLLIPLIIEQFLAISLGIADTMMVSTVGESAVSGVSLL